MPGFRGQAAERRKRYRHQVNKVFLPDAGITLIRNEGFSESGIIPNETLDVTLDVTLKLKNITNSIGNDDESWCVLTDHGVSF